MQIKFYDGSAEPVFIHTFRSGCTTPIENFPYTRKDGDETIDFTLTFPDSTVLQWIQISDNCNEVERLPQNVVDKIKKYLVDNNKHIKTTVSITSSAKKKLIELSKKTGVKQSYILETGLLLYMDELERKYEARK